MYEKPFTLEIVAPDRVLFTGDATSLSAPGIEGGFQVLARHAPFLSLLEVGEVKIKGIDGRDMVFAACGGVVEVRGSRVVVLVDAAERADEIDVPRAQASRERAEKRLRTPATDIDADRARASLARALNRLRIAARK